MKWTKEICILTLLGVGMLTGCPGPDGDGGGTSQPTLFDKVDTTSQLTIKAAQAVSDAAEALLSDVTSEATLVSLSQKLLDDATKMRDDAQKTYDNAQAVVDKIKEEEQSSASGGSSSIRARESARLQVAKAVLEAAKEALDNAKYVFKSAQSVQKNARNNLDTSHAIIRRIIKAVRQVRVLAQGVRVANKSVETVKQEDTETIVLFSGTVERSSQNQYVATMEVGTLPFSIEDAGIGTGALSARYESGGVGDAFDFIAAGRGILFVPGKNGNVPTSGKYVYTITKTKTGDNKEAREVTITITVEQPQETLILYPAFSTVLATDPVVVTDSGVGAGALSVAYESGGAGDRFTAIPDVANRRIRFTPKGGDDAPTPGAYVYTIAKTKTGDNKKAQDLGVVINVVSAIQSKQETIDIDISSSPGTDDGAENSFSMMEGRNYTIFLTDTGVGTGALSARYKSGGSGDKFTVTLDAPNRGISFEPKKDGDAPTPGTYVYTIAKTKTGSNTKAQDVDFTIIVIKGTLILEKPSVTLDGVTNAMSPAPTLVTDREDGSKENPAIINIANSAWEDTKKSFKILLPGATFESDNEEVATVDGNGVVTLVGSGSTTITLTKNRKTYKITLTVGTKRILADHVSAGGYHTLAIHSDDTLWAWGYNRYGQLGIGNRNKQDTPVKVGSATTWKVVSAKYEHIMAIQDDGTLWVWGNNNNGQLGLGNIDNQHTPVKVGSETWKAVAAGKLHTVAIKSDGTLWAWGLNEYGQLGLGDKGFDTNRNVPVKVGSETWKAVSAGESHTVAIRSDDTLWAWGLNDSGQLGIGNRNNQDVPVKVGSATWKAVSAGGSHTVAIHSDDTLWAWGYNRYGQLGLGDNGVASLEAKGVDTNRDVPVKVGSATWKGVSAGGSHTVAIHSDDTLWAWGLNNYGQLGLGDKGFKTNRNVPVKVGIATWKAVSAGGSHTVAIHSDNALWAWGRNNYGQLGRSGDTKVPRRVE